MKNILLCLFFILFSCEFNIDERISKMEKPIFLRAKSKKGNTIILQSVSGKIIIINEIYISSTIANSWDVGDIVFPCYRETNK